MKSTHTTTTINPLVVSAISTFPTQSRPQKKPKRFKDNGTRTIYALVASEKQCIEDERLDVIEGFVKTLRKHKPGAIRDFVVAAVYDAILKRAEEATKQS